MESAFKQNKTFRNCSNKYFMRKIGLYWFLVQLINNYTPSSMKALQYGPGKLYKMGKKICFINIIWGPVTGTVET